MVKKIKKPQPASKTRCQFESSFSASINMLNDLTKNIVTNIKPITNKIDATSCLSLSDVISHGLLIINYRSFVAPIGATKAKCADLQSNIFS